MLPILNMRPYRAQYMLGKSCALGYLNWQIKPTPFPNEMSSKRRIITITIRHIILRPLFCLKHDVSDVGFCLRLQIAEMSCYK
jgi:hypothetical protein